MAAVRAASRPPSPPAIRHAVKEVDVLLDTALVASTACDNIAYECRVSYKWSIRRVHGQHTATYQSTDWLGNVPSQTATFTVN